MDGLRYFLIPGMTLVGATGFLLGSEYVWLGAATFPVLMALDIVLPPDHKVRAQGTALLGNLAIYLQLPCMILLVWAFARSVAIGINPIAGAGASGWQLAGSLLSLGWLSAVPTLPVAHELMHRRHWFPRYIAKCLSAFYGDPNRDIAHIVTHHVHLDTAKDSDTPRRGQTIYSFVFQATWGSYKDSWEKTVEILGKLGHAKLGWRNVIWLLPLLSGSIIAYIGVTAGGVAALTGLAAMVMAKMFVEGFNYFQHYGLIRVEGAPIDVHHAWNHLGVIVRPIGAEITNHINHHLDGHIPFYALKPEPQAPQMPSLFLCFACGLIPPIWFRYIAQPRLKDWDQRFATPGERALADQANARAGWPRWLAGA
jgi:xylene monooxygenase subunit XylM